MLEKHDPASSSKDKVVMVLSQVVECRYLLARVYWSCKLRMWCLALLLSRSHCHWIVPRALRAPEGPTRIVSIGCMIARSQYLAHQTAVRRVQLLAVDALHGHN
ncbi:hypothetical protein LIA77_10088 [Sarocladium implicatum]|nr:hypothetical protein LIA77_10088 [Sarocladium implicatum]